MPYWRIFYHLVWAFKNREGSLTSEIEARLHPLWWKTAERIGCSMLAANGWENHVHIILSIPPSLRVSDVVHRLKGARAHELRLAWQDSYGVFSVGQRSLPVAIAYVKNQKVHHTRGSTNQWLEYWDEDSPHPGDQIREGVEDYSTDEFIL